jgi:hypothetical protein
LAQLADNGGPGVGAAMGVAVGEATGPLGWDGVCELPPHTVRVSPASAMIAGLFRLRKEECIAVLSMNAI